MTLAGIQPEFNLARLRSLCWVELKIELVMAERDQRQTDDQDNLIFRSCFADRCALKQLH